MAAGHSMLYSMKGHSRFFSGVGVRWVRAETSSMSHVYLNLSKLQAQLSFWELRNPILHPGSDTFDPSKFALDLWGPFAMETPYELRSVLLVGHKDMDYMSRAHSPQIKPIFPT